MWLATAKGMETDGLSGEVHVAADESMRPKGVDPEGTTEQADGADLRTAADEDDRSRRMGLQVGPPGGREWPSCRRRLEPFLLIASHLRRFPPSIATERYWHLTDWG